MSYFTFESGVKRIILGRESETFFLGREIGRFMSGDEFFAFLFPDKNVVDVSGQGLVKDVGIDARRGSNDRYRFLYALFEFSFFFLNTLYYSM